jgi:hypothetical protein
MHTLGDSARLLMSHLSTTLTHPCLEGQYGDKFRQQCSILEEPRSPKPRSIPRLQTGLDRSCYVN